MSRALSLKSILLASILWGAFQIVNAQMSVLHDKQPTQLIKEVLIGRGILVDNVHYAGMIEALGEFQNPTAKALFPTGMVLSTGKADDMVGPNDNPKTSTVNGSPGDRNLYTIAGGRTFDGAKLEFDFKADRDSVSLNFVFASEEYNDYVGSSFNDAFSLVISGPGFGTGKNLAVVPGTSTPITVNSVNPNVNRQYYVDNNPYTLVGRINESVKAGLDQDVLANLEYDGMTKSISVGFRVVPKQVYHFQIVISDAGDGTVDSAVLLEGKSFKSLEQSKHAIRRAQIAAQREADSLAQVQIVQDSLAKIAYAAEQERIKAQEKEAAEDTEWGMPDPEEDSPTDPAEELRKSNQKRLDSLERAEPKTGYQLAPNSENPSKSNHSIEEKIQLKAVEETPKPAVNAEPTAVKPAELLPPTQQELKETVQFEPSSYFVPKPSEARLHELGKMLASHPEMRAGIYLPAGEPLDVLNMRYDMMRFEMLKAGAKSEQIFRNGFSFASPDAAKNIQRAEVWLRKE